MSNLHYTFIKPATFLGRAENPRDIFPLSESTAAQLFQHGVIRPSSAIEIERFKNLQQAEVDDEALNRQIDEFEEMAIINTAMATQIQQNEKRIAELEEMVALLKEKQASPKK